MNSKSLQEHFPEVYRDFFSKCPIVVSIPGFFTWAGEYSSWAGGISITQHLPQRIYIGIEPIHLKSINIQSFLALNLTSQQFEPVSFDNFALQTIFTNYLKKFYYQNHKCKKGVNIYILSELRFGSGRGFYTTISGGVSIALFLLMKLLNTNEIEQFSNWHLEDFGSKRYLKFKPLLNFQAKLMTVLIGSSAPYHFPAVCQRSLYPIIWFSGTKQITNDFLDPYLKSDNLDFFLNYLDNLESFFCRIDKLFNITRNNPLYFYDFGCISFGIPYRADIDDPRMFQHNYQMSIKIQNLIKTISPFVNNTVKKHSIYHDLWHNNNYNFLKKQIEFNSYLSWEGLYVLLDAYQSGKIEKLITFFNKENKIIDLTHTGDFSYAPTQEVRFLLDKLIKKYCGIPVGLIHKIGSSECLFVAAARHLRTNFMEILDQIHKTTDVNLCLDYASWIDGYEEEGVKVEQHLAEGIGSKFISEGTVTLRKWTAAESPTTELSTLEKLDEEQKNIDLLIDLPEEKIYIRGQKLTSRELRSSSATIDILKILLENIGKSIPCKNLPESSYSQDRNEMQSKIISPLTKIIKQKTGKKIPLKITGGLTEFYLKLEPSEMDIRIIEKVF